MTPRFLPFLPSLTLALGLGLATGCPSTGTSGGASTGGRGTTNGTGGSGSTGGTGGGMTCSGPYGTITCSVGEYCTTSEPTCFPLVASSGGSTGRPAEGSSSGGRAGSSGGTGTGTSGGKYDLDAGPPYTPGWPKWHNDNADRGRSQADTSMNSGVVLWKFSVGVPQASGVNGLTDPNPSYLNSPVVDASGNVYQLGMDGTFYALGDGGTLLWSAPLLPPNPDHHPATPIIAANDTIYLETGADGASVTTPGQLYHLDAVTGKILFQAGPPIGQLGAQADGFDVCPSIGADGLLFEGDDYYTWITYQTNSDGSFSQATSAALPLFGERLALALDPSDNSYWCAYNLCTGVTSPAAGFTVMPGWNPSGNPIGSAPGMGSSWTNSDLAYDLGHTGWLMVEAGTQDGGTGSTEVVAMDPSDGSAHWDTKLPSGPTPGSFNPTTKEGLFTSDVGNSAPAIGSDGTVYVGNVDGLYSLDGGTGAIGWTYKPSQDTGASADVDTAAAIGGDGTIFFGTAGGTFYAVQPDGGERFHYATGGRISSSPAIGPDGTVFFVSDDGYLYAIH